MKVKLEDVQLVDVFKAKKKYVMVLYMGRGEVKNIYIDEEEAQKYQDKIGQKVTLEADVYENKEGKMIIRL